MYDSGSAPLDTQKIVLSEISRTLGVPSAQLHLESDFIRNGGDSLSAIQLQAALRKRGIQIGVVSVLKCCDLIHLVTDCTRARDMQLQDGGNRIRKAENSDKTPLANRKRHRSITAQIGARKQVSKCMRYPMTEMQISLVVSTKANPGRNVIEYIETHRSENIPALKAAWEQVLALEPIFRMSFEVDESGGFMYDGDCAAPFVWVETMVETESSYRCEVETPLTADCHGIGTGWTFKVITLQVPGSASRSTVIWRVHHARIDGTSFALVRDKVRRVMAGEQVKAGPSFASIAVQLQTLQMQAAQEAVAFWAQMRKDNPTSSEPTRLLLPAPDAPDDADVLPSTFGKVWIHSNHDKLSAHAQAAGVTVASLYYSAWALVLSMYSDSKHVSFGVILSGRSLPIADVMYVVGPTINTLPLHISIDPESTVEFHTRNVFLSLLDLTTFQYSIPSHGFVRKFSSAVNIRFDSPGRTGTKSDPIEDPHSRVRSDFPIHVEIGTNGRICLEYDTGRFFEAHMKRLGASFVDALDTILDVGSSVASCLDRLMGGPRRVELARMGNWTSHLTRPGSNIEDLTTLFSRAAEKHPSAVAIEHGSCVLTYGELHAKSSTVAKHLSVVVRPGDVVGVHADSTINWIVAIYGVLKAGATYCPFDQQLPHVARDANFLASGAQVFLTGSSAAKAGKPTSCQICLSVEELLLQPGIPANNGPHNAKSSPLSVAYLCFTSGSTGQPKGVMCRHNGLVAFQKDFRVRLCARPGWRIAQFMSLGFDGSIHEIFSALSYGSTLVLKDPWNPFSHLRSCHAVIMTTTVSQALAPTEYSNLKAVYLVGEVVPQSVCDTWASHRQLFNMYGPTEATCGATIKELFRNQEVTIGVPCSSVRVYILDSHQRVVPWGVVGEICLAGVQVSLGYIGRPDETARRFLPDHINPHYIGDRMYKTGDRAYWNEQGELVFLGREDRQVKLRGFRIDLEDLEIRISRASEKCSAAAVTTSSDKDHLVALVQPSGLDLKEFESDLRRHVPSYAIPHQIAAVDKFPMTPVGKVDYKCIAATASYSFETMRSAPKATVTIVIKALRESLRIPDAKDIDLQSKFSDLGGDSLLAIAFRHRLSHYLKKPISTRLILETATMQDLAEALDMGILQTKVPTMDPIDDHSVLETSVLGRNDLSPIERSWWHRYQVGGQTSSFNVTYACQLSSTVKVTRLVEALNHVLKRHLIFRCRYVCSEDDPSKVVRIYSPNPPRVREVHSISIEDEVNTPFSLEDREEDLIRVSVSATHMLIVVSHVMCDLTTLQSMLQEVADRYSGIQRPLTSKTYFEATTWSRPAITSHLSFWPQYLANAPRQRLYSAGGCGSSSEIIPKPWSGSSYACEVPGTIYEDSLRFSSHNKITMHQLSLAAVALALQPSDTEMCDITLGAPYMNRDPKDLRVIGLFVEPLPIRIRYQLPAATGKEPSISFVKAVQESSRAALSHVVSWNQLLSHLCIDQRSYPVHPLFDTMVTFHGADHEIQFPIGGARFVPTWAQGAKFKVMAEFVARSTGMLTLRIEYSDEFLTRDDARVLAHLIVEAFRGLTGGESCDAVLRKVRRMRSDHATGGHPQVDDDDPFVEITMGSMTTE